MNCIETRDLMTLYIDEQCSTREKEMMEQHLANCPSCMAEYEELRFLVSQLGNIEELDVPDHFHEDLMKKIDMIKPSKKNFIKKSIQYTSMIAAALILLVSFGLFGIQTLLNSSMNKESEDAAPTVGATMAGFESESILMDQKTYAKDSTNQEAPSLTAKNTAQDSEEDQVNGEMRIQEEAPLDGAGEDSASGSMGLDENDGASLNAPKPETEFTEGSVIETAGSIEIDEELTFSEAKITANEEESKQQEANQKIPFYILFLIGISMLVIVLILVRIILVRRKNHH